VLANGLPSTAFPPWLRPLVTPLDDTLATGTLTVSMWHGMFVILRTDKLSFETTAAVTWRWLCSIHFEEEIEKERKSRWQTKNNDKSADDASDAKCRV